MDHKTVLCSNVIMPLSEKNAGGPGFYCPSYNFILDTKVIPLLQTGNVCCKNEKSRHRSKDVYYNTVFGKKRDRNDAILTGEFGMTRLLLQNGYKVTCLHPDVDDRGQLKMTLFMKNNWIEGNNRACPPISYHDCMRIIKKPIVRPPEDFDYSILDCPVYGQCISDPKYNWRSKRQFYDFFGYSEEIILKKFNFDSKMSSQVNMRIQKRQTVSTPHAAAVAHHENSEGDLAQQVHSIRQQLEDITDDIRNCLTRSKVETMNHKFTGACKFTGPCSFEGIVIVPDIPRTSRCAVNRVFVEEYAEPLPDLIITSLSRPNMPYYYYDDGTTSDFYLEVPMSAGTKYFVCDFTEPYTILLTDPEPGSVESKIVKFTLINLDPSAFASHVEVASNSAPYYYDGNTQYPIVNGSANDGIQELTVIFTNGYDSPPLVYQSAYSRYVPP